MPASPLNIEPLNPVACGSLLAKVGDELRAIVVVKATFTLAHERSAWPIEPLPLVATDEHVAGHPTNPLLAASDLAPALPGAGAVFSATAHARGGSPVTEMAVRVAVFQEGAAVLNKHLYVVGDRIKGGEPTPFLRMPIVYERAFGGPAIATNPAGVGARGGAQPNVIDRRQPDKPAGFGPIAPTWAPRAAAMRRLSGVPREDDVAVYPADAPFEALHAAPLDQRIDVLRGDEWIVLDGLHPAYARIQTQLPFARALARYRASDHDALTPIELAGDTLIVDSDRLVASVVWRGHVVVSSVEEARSLRIFAALEVPTVAIAWPTAAPVEPAESSEPSEPQRPTSEWPEEIPDTTSERDVTAIRAAIAAEWGHAPDLDRTAEVDERAASNPPLPFLPNATPLIDVTRSVAPHVRIEHKSTGTLDIDQKAVRRTLPFKRSRRRTLGRARSQADATPEGTTAKPGAIDAAMAAADAVTADDPAIDVRVRAEARVRLGRPLSGLELAGADLANAELDGADLEGIDLTGAQLAGAQLAGAKLARADLSRAVLDGASLDEADLTEAKLERARGRHACLFGVRGARASFCRGDWEGADFSDAELEATDFTGASLAGARFASSRLGAARFVDARAEKASFEGAQARGAKADGATLSGASFRLAELRGASFEGAELTGARFDGARLDGASLFRSNAAGAKFAGADLRGAKLGRLVATGAELTAADLRGADLRGAKLAGAAIDQATLRDAQATLADLSNARLARSDLTSAVLREANLAGADLTDARLDRADLRDANLTGATLTGASRRGLKMQGARVKDVIDGPAKG